MPSLPLPRRVAALEEYYLSRPVREQQARLAEIGPERLVDDPGITVQVLSGSGPGAGRLPPTRARPSRLRPADIAKLAYQNADQLPGL